MERDALKRSAALWSREAIRREPGRADRRRGPSAGSRWRCRAGPWECRRRGFSSGAPEIGHRVGNGGRRWRRRSPTCPPTIAGRTGRRDRRRPARHELAGIEEHRRDVDGRGGCGGSPKTPAARYGHTGQVRPQGARRAAPRLHPGRSGRTCPGAGISPKPPPT